MSQQHDCGGDAAAYVLGALEKSEVAGFERHMADCVVCRDEVATLQLVADALPMAAPQYEVPKELRRSVISAVRAEPRASAAAPARRAWAWPRLMVARPAFGLAAAAALVVVALGAGALIGSGGSSGTRVIRASVGDATIRLSGAHGELIVNKLGAPPPGRIYEVWLKRPGQPPAPTSTLFSVTRGGQSDVGLPGNLHGVSAVLVTAERDGGSQVPTSQPVIVAPLTSPA